MFGIRANLAMQRLYNWYIERHQSPYMALVEARPSAVLTFDAGPFAPYQLIILVRDGQFVMFMDDNDPGSIPVQQALGSVATAPAGVFQRVADTLRWFEGMQRSHGHHKRADWYSGKLLDVMTVLGQDTSELVAKAQLRDMQRMIDAALTEPVDVVVTSLDRHAKRLLEAGDLSNAARALYAAARAAELASARGDRRYNDDDIEQRLAEVLELTIIGAQVDFEADLRRRLAIYTGEYL